MKSPNQIVIDEIPNWAIVQFHIELDRLRSEYNVRVRIKDDGRTNKVLRELPTANECYND
jgi:GMP synthase-like glutamine amidotransferase